MLDFRPHRLLPSGHAQTIAGCLLAGTLTPYRAVKHTVELDDGDAVVLHDDTPDGWSPGDRMALLVHGLCGSHESPYMVRIAAKLNARGVRTFRMDLRRSGAGRKLARLPYHAGRSEDVQAVIETMGKLSDCSPTYVVGFSLGGNIVLKFLGENAQSLPAMIVGGVAVNPPIDLSASVRWLKRPLSRFYDRHFVRLLCREAADANGFHPEAPQPKFDRKPRSLFEFDDLYTAPICGFGTAENYYQRSSSQQFIPKISVPTVILAAGDDPVIPSRLFEELTAPSHVAVHICRYGGHLGYISRNGDDPDRRWMDWRVVEWVTD